MKNQLYDRSVVATATNTNKSENQDNKGDFTSDKLNFIIIADGLGSYKYPKLASERVVDFFTSEAQIISSLAPLPMINFADLFKRSKEKLIAFAKENFKEDDIKDEDLYGTTAISVFEYEELISVGYVGNGAVWHIRGNFNDFPASFHYPWNAVNYLNPHTIPEKGKEALYRLISDSNDISECIPTTITIEKDKSFGDIIMVCTDGIYSADQVKAGKNDKGIWVRFEPTMLKFFECLKDFFKSQGHYTRGKLTEMLNTYLEEIKPTLDDDATIGVLVTNEALEYQNKINWLKTDESHSDNQV